MPAPSLRACLICCLGGGLTNQENMVENCLALAALTGRALVLPSPVVVEAGGA